MHYTYIPARLSGRGVSIGSWYLGLRALIARRLGLRALAALTIAEASITKDAQNIQSVITLQSEIGKARACDKEHAKSLAQSLHMRSMTAENAFRKRAPDIAKRSHLRAEATVGV